MSLLPICAAVLTFLFSQGGCSEQVHQYMSNNEDEFTFYKTEFNCSADQKVLFEMMVLNIHPGSENCNAYIQRADALEFWSDINTCINEGKSTVEGFDIEGCEINPEMNSILYRVDPMLIVMGERVTLPCGSKEEPEILQMTLHYTCPQSDEMPNFVDHHHAGGGIMTVPQGMSTPPELPPTESELTTGPVTEETTTTTTQKTTTTPSTPAGPLTTKLATVTLTTKLATVIKKTTMKLMDKTTHKPILKSNSQLTPDQLAIIVVPSVIAGAVVVTIIALIFFCCLKRGDPKNGDHQRVSLFSRRFSTASQASDVSLNNIQPISTKP